MLAFVKMGLILMWLSDSGEAIVGLVVAAVIAALAVLWYAREGRNRALEQAVMHSEFGVPADFRGSLAVAEHQPGTYLRLSKTTPENRRLQFYYRWIVGMGRQAVFDEVTFDSFSCLVKLKRKDKYTETAFTEFTAIRMREVAARRGGGSLWHLELLPREGRAVPFVTSLIGDRRAAFEQTAALAKVISAIMAVPVQVCVAGNVWTPGWPPKTPVVS